MAFLACSTDFSYCFKYLYSPDKMYSARASRNMAFPPQILVPHNFLAWPIALNTFCSLKRYTQLQASSRKPTAIISGISLCMQILSSSSTATQSPLWWYTLNLAMSLVYSPPTRAPSITNRFGCLLETNANSSSANSTWESPESSSYNSLWNWCDLSSDKHWKNFK